MTYPTKEQVDAQPSIAKAALRFGISFSEAWEIHVFGRVSTKTAAFWNTCRKEPGHA